MVSMALAVTSVVMKLLELAPVREL